MAKEIWLLPAEKKIEVVIRSAIKKMRKFLQDATINIYIKFYLEINSTSGYLLAGIYLIQ